MDSTLFRDDITAADALFEAQKIAFSPMTFQAARSLRDLGVLALLFNQGEVGLEESTIANQLGLSKYGARVLLESGLSTGIVSLEEGKYRLTKTGYYILHDPMTRANMDYAHDVCYQGMFYLESAIKDEIPSGLRVFDDSESIYPLLTMLPKRARESWHRFNAFYSQPAAHKALGIVFEDPPETVLDVGGNTGQWAIACAEYSDSVNVTVLDLPELIVEARRNVESTEYLSRIHFQALDVRSPAIQFPRGFQVIWMSHFLDCFSETEITTILRCAAESMDDDARLFILEPYWDRQTNVAAAYCLINTSLYFTAIANGKSRLYRSEDMLACIEKAGLRVLREYDGLGVCHTLIECKKGRK